MATVGRYPPSKYWLNEITKIQDELTPEMLKRPDATSDPEWNRYWMKKRVLYEVDKEHGVCYVINNRPEKLNAGTPFKATEACMIARDDPDVKVIVLSAVGRAFSTGYDIAPRIPKDKKVERRRRSAAERFSQTHREVYMTDYYRRCLWDNPKPIIGSVHGFCLAGSCNMLAHCDIIIAADNAIFGYPPVRYGNTGATHTFLPHYVGLRKSKELCLTGNMMSAQEAYDFHWINKVVPIDKLEEETDKFARAMASLPLNTLAFAKRAINNFYENQGLRSQLDYAEALKALASTYEGTEVGSPRWRQTRPKEVGLTTFLRERDEAFIEVDKWWRAKQVTLPKFEKETKDDPYNKKRETEDPLEILKIRFAKGEISKEEYEETKKILKE